MKIYQKFIKASYLDEANSRVINLFIAKSSASFHPEATKRLIEIIKEEKKSVPESEDEDENV